MLQDVQRAATTGETPRYTLELMETKPGYDLVKKTLGESQQGKKMLKSLERASIEGGLQKILNKEGHIDFAKARHELKDPFFAGKVRDVMGADGVRFFKNARTYGDNIAKNLELLEQRSPGLLETLLDRKISDGAKYAMWGLAVPTKGKSLAPLFVDFVGKGYRERKLWKILEDPKVRETTRRLGRKDLYPEETEKLISKLIAQAHAANRPEEDE